MHTSKHVTSFKRYTGHYRRRYLLPIGFLLVSFLLMILPLSGFIASDKAVLAYVFIPQIRAAHSTVEYATGVSQTVQQLLNTHRENEQLTQEIQTARLLAAQANDVFAENERLTRLLQLKKNYPWKGVWAKVAYREPTQWNTVILDKGTADGIAPRSAVLGIYHRQEGLVGVVVEVTDNTSKVLLLRDEDFSAAVRLEHSGAEGLLTGMGLRALQVKYIPLLTQIELGDKVFTSASSSVFPAGILVGQVSGVEENISFKTSLTVEVTPQIQLSAIREVFVLTQEK